MVQSLHYKLNTNRSSCMFNQQNKNGKFFMYRHCNRAEVMEPLCLHLWLHSWNLKAQKNQTTTLDAPWISWTCLFLKSSSGSSQAQKSSINVSERLIINSILKFKAPPPAAPEMFQKAEYDCFSVSHNTPRHRGVLFSAEHSALAWLQQPPLKGHLLILFSSSHPAFSITATRLITVAPSV